MTRARRPKLILRDGQWWLRAAWWPSVLLGPYRTAREALAAADQLAVQQARIEPR